MRPPDPPAFISRAVLQARRFYLELAPPRGRELSVLCGGWERCAPDYEVNRTRFPYFGLEFVVSGEGELGLNGRSHRLRRGSAFAYGPAHPHHIRTDPAKNLIKYFVDLAGPGWGPRLQESGLAPGECRLITDPDETAAAFEQVLAAGQRGGRHAGPIAALQVRVLLLRMADSRPPVADRHRSWQTFNRCRAYVDAHFLTLTSAEQVAAECHVDAAYLSRLFAAHGGETPYRYLMRKRMAHAAELLDGGELMVREVADRLGLDAFQFSRAFKRVHGLPPAKFLMRYGDYATRTAPESVPARKSANA